MKMNTRMILALDETDESRALKIADEVADLVDAIKINWPLVLSTSPEMITRLSRMAPVICDFKIADIPNTDRLIVEQVQKRGAAGVIVHAFTGSDSLSAAVKAAEDLDVFVVTEMSHPGGQEFTAPLAERFASMAVEAGASGVIAPATRPESIAKVRRIVGDLLILTPGVGAQGGSASDAISMGADHVIVGRSIYGSPRPREAAERLVEEIQKVIQAP
ncbi:MAG: orotidine-5'-phosphate decarboxylase [Methanomassiliicoccus sp.]|nr:orotidine-5'-phosphate decarboxylase [Methanomassiliicoccus sp.]